MPQNSTLPQEVFEFQWDIHVDGYRWIETQPADPEGDSGMFLTDGRPLGASGFAVDRYSPLALHSGLFRVFADTKPTSEEVKAFADKFGRLGGDAAEMIVLPDEPVEKGHLVGTGERLRVWTEEILAMRQAIDLWDKARKGDYKGLAQFIRWDEKGVHYASHPDLGPNELPEPPFRKILTVVATEDLRPDLLQRFRRGDVIEPALYYVQRVVNDRMKERISPRLLWSPDRSRLRLYFVPHSLLGALWLQFTHAIERDNDFRTCAECGMWFELSPQTARSNKVYCSNACRTKAYRKRKAEAERLFAEGTNIGDIARRLDADPKAVSRWVGGGS